METFNHAFTTGVWNVKKGKEEEFIKEWIAFATWTKDKYIGSAKLLQDSEDSCRFISVSEWGSTDLIASWRESQEFRDSLSRITDLLVEPSKPRIMKEAAHVGESISSYDRPVLFDL